jgi:adenine-specific DNA-methyltransferase
MAQTENQKKLLKILNEIFQLDQSDLDFGIYRIMNTKSKEINEFLDKDLISSVSKAFSSNDNSSIQKELDEKVKSFREDGFTEEQIDNNTKIIALREQLSSSSTSSNLENDVFSHLAIFFKRYYKDGDFVSLRRYKKDTYAIPYEGEEVKLHWANSDQYYVKSGEYFRDYTFVVNDKTIHLKLSDAETESNNNKATSDKERRFVILESNPCEVINNELYINFEYKAVGKENQDKLNESAIAKALESIEGLEFLTALNELAPTEKNKTRTIFEKHLKSYTSRNSFDYFIHKDLGGFLGRELDFYIKNEMLFLDDIMDSPIKYEEVMGKVKIFKEVSSKIISFLTQLEELQKKLWEKKKFIIETNYCITLDKINEDYYKEIFACKEQLSEWKTLFDVDIQNVNDLKEEKYLVLDTKFFDMKFKYAILSEFDNLDEDIDGVLINSENFGALNLLQDRYKEQVKTVYIDPPYNTGNDGFLYNDTYQHSSWMSFIFDRVALSKSLMSESSVLFSSIDDYEQINLQFTLDCVFGKENYRNSIFWHRTYAGKTISKSLPWNVDTILFYAKNQTTNINNVTKEFSKADIEAYNKDDGDGRGKYTTVSLQKTSSPGPQTTYDYIDNNGKVWKCPAKGWRMIQAKLRALEDDNKLYITDKTFREKYYLKERMKIGKQLDNFWSDIGNMNRNKSEDLGFVGQKPEKLIKRFIDLGSNEKDYILDYFSGSGTTATVAYKTNRKFIAIEMGEYFDKYMMVRLKNTFYGTKGGIDNKRNGGMLKYFKLESYEDTLNNLEFKKTKKQNEALELYPQAKDDYILNYSLDVESQGSLLSIDTFKTPFDYKLKIATSSVGETKDTNIDLVETFNYLLGLVVKRIELLKGYLVVEGQNLKKEKILIIWRDGQNSDELNEFFKKMDWSVYDREFDTIYVNGDNNLENLRKDEDHFKVKLIEQEFKRLMFNE